jgi:hypothetical protein
LSGGAIASCPRIKKVLQRTPELPSRIYLSAAALEWIRDNHAVTDGGATSARKPPAAMTH